MKAKQKWREARMFARAMASPATPILAQIILAQIILAQIILAQIILAQIIPIRRCNLACTYCNEYDKDSPPVETEELLRRVDKLCELGTRITTAAVANRPFIPIWIC